MTETHISIDLTTPVKKAQLHSSQQAADATSVEDTDTSPAEAAELSPIIDLTATSPETELKSLFN